MQDKIKPDKILQLKCSTLSVKTDTIFIAQFRNIPLTKYAMERRVPNKLR